MEQRNRKTDRKGRVGIKKQKDRHKRKSWNKETERQTDRKERVGVKKQKDRQKRKSWSKETEVQTEMELEEINYERRMKTESVATILFWLLSF